MENQNQESGNAVVAIIQLICGIVALYAGISAMSML